MRNHFSKQGEGVTPCDRGSFVLCTSSISSVPSLSISNKRSCKVNRCCKSGTHRSPLGLAEVAKDKIFFSQSQWKSLVFRLPWTTIQDPAIHFLHCLAINIDPSNHSPWFFVPHAVHLVSWCLNFSESFTGLVTFTANDCKGSLVPGTILILLGFLLSLDPARPDNQSQILPHPLKVRCCHPLLVLINFCVSWDSWLQARKINFG